MKFKNISIIKRKQSNSYSARYRRNGKQYTISAKTQKECYNKLKIALNNTSPHPVKKITTLIEWVNKWLEIYKKPQVRTSTYKGIELLVKNHFKGSIFNKPIEDIKQIEIENYINNIQFERVKQNVYIYLKEIFNKAISNNLITTNPLSDTKKPKHTKAEKRALTINEQTQFENYCKNNKENYIYLVCLWQGLRLGELRALETQDIDFNKNTISINKSINDISNENLTKNKYSNRVMPMFEKTKNLLIELKKETNQRLFNHSKDYISRKLQEILKTLNIQNITMHSLRHTFITRCQEQNIPLYIIQNWVGHAQGSEITTRVYTHKQDEIEKNIIDKINNK